MVVVCHWSISCVWQVALPAKKKSLDSLMNYFYFWPHWQMISGGLGGLYVPPTEVDPPGSLNSRLLPGHLHCQAPPWRIPSLPAPPYRIPSLPWSPTHLLPQLQGTHHPTMVRLSTVRGRAFWLCFSPSYSPVSVVRFISATHRDN